MIKIPATFILLQLFIPAFGQQIIPGNYDTGLKLAYDSSTKMVTGYYENYTGWDEETNDSRFSCIFYIEGAVTGNKFNINTYYPADKKDDLLQGTLEIAANKKVKIKLPEEHGGCWNVQHFVDDPVEFTLEKNLSWIQVRYVVADMIFFYGDKFGDNRLKSYLVKNDFVCIEKIEQDWAYCTYFGKDTTKGWLRLGDLNKL